MAGTVKENLIAAKALIDTPEKWAHEEMQRRINGGECLCAFDACYAASPLDGGELVDVMERAVPASFVPRESFTSKTAQYNDDPAITHADVMALFQRAIDAQDGAL